jgi:hypothetical protein
MGSNTHDGVFLVTWQAIIGFSVTLATVPDIIGRRKDGCSMQCSRKEGALLEYLLCFSLAQSKNIIADHDQ